MDKTQQIRHWAEIQIALCQKAPMLHFKEREIWWSSIGINVGHEQDGRNYWCETPVLVVKKYTKDTVLAVPLTSQEKEGEHSTSVLFRERKRTVLLEQSRVLSSQRFSRKIGMLGGDEFEEVRSKLKNLI